MANTLTGLIPVIYEALDVVSRELVGFIPAVARDSSAERAAVGQTISYHVAPPATVGDIAPGSLPPDDGDQVLGVSSMTIDKSKYSPVRWSGEELLSVNLTGTAALMMRDQFANSMRALVNLIEIDLAVAGAAGASRAYGTAGTPPFGTANDFTDFAGVHQILDDNGAPMVDRQLVLGSAAIANIRGKQSSLFKVNEAGSDDLLRRGIVGTIEGFDVHNSNAVGTAVKGTGMAYVRDASGTQAIGATVIPLITGSGTILAGDSVTFAGDTNIYVVATGIAAPGSITLALPGLRKTLANGVALTIGASHVANLAFSRSAIHLVTRAPAMPPGGDNSEDVTEVVDPLSGLAFQIAMYKQYRRVKYEVGIAWGKKVSKAEHVAELLG